MVLQSSIAFPNAQLIPLCHLDILANHFTHHIFKLNLGLPTQFFSRFRRVTEQCIDFGWAKVTWIHFHTRLPRGHIDTFLREPAATPIELDPNFAEGGAYKITNRALPASGHDIVIGLGLLQH